MSLEVIERDLNALKEFAIVGSVLLLGGEGLLHPAIVDIMRLVKRIRIDHSTVVITNGTLLHRMPEEFWQELEELQISVYAGKDSHLELARTKSEQYGFGLHSTVFETFFRQLKQTPDDGVASFETCHWRQGHCTTVDNGHLYLCAQSCFFPKAIMGLPAETDGLPLAGLTEEKLVAFLNRTEPFEACKICTANTMEPEPWREASSRKTWLEESRLTNAPSLASNPVADSIP